MGVFVKICGCCSGPDVAAVAAMQPDAIGFIQWTGSKRYVPPDKVREWTIDVPPSILKVGVFVDASAEEIRRAVEAGGFDIVQLHGAETPDFCAALPFRRWKVIHLNKPLPAAPGDFDVDAFLLDYHGGEQPGGTGMAVDWQAAAQWVANSSKPVILAGGLQPHNVAAAIASVHPFGVDVSSGVERAVGQKDWNKVKDFIEICRSAP